MLQAVVSTKFLQEVDAAFRTLAGSGGANLLVGLFTNNPGLTVDTLLTDLDEPTFTGYARVAPTMQALELDGNGNYIDDISAITFQPTATPGSPVTIQGAFLAVTISATAYLLAAELFDDPKVLAATTDAIDIIWQNMWLNAPNYGGLAFVG